MDWPKESERGRKRRAGGGFLVDDDKSEAKKKKKKNDVRSHRLKLTEHKPSAVRHAELDDGRYRCGTISGISVAFHREVAKFKRALPRGRSTPPFGKPSTKASRRNQREKVIN